MSEPIPPAPTMPASLPVMARLDPPADVQEAVAGALRACRAWQPVAVPPKPGEGPPSPTLAASTVEAGICDLIGDWPHHAKQAAYLAVGAGVVLGFGAAGALLMLRRMLRGLGRTRLGWWLWDRLREPWRNARVGSLGALAGLLAGAVLNSLLLKLGLDGPGVANACYLGGTLVGGCGMVWARRRGVLHVTGQALR